MGSTKLEAASTLGLPMFGLLLTVSQKLRTEELKARDFTHTSFPIKFNAPNNIQLSHYFFEPSAYFIMVTDSMGQEFRLDAGGMAGLGPWLGNLKSWGLTRPRRATSIPRFPPTSLILGPITCRLELPTRASSGGVSACFLTAWRPRAA